MSLGHLYPMYQISEMVLEETPFVIWVQTSYMGLVNAFKKDFDAGYKQLIDA